MAYKKATAVLDEAARARLRGPFASGAASLRRDQDDDDDDLLVDLVHEFYDDGERGADATARGGVSSSPEPEPTEWKDALREALADATSDAAAARIRARPSAPSGMPFATAAT